MFSGLTNQFTSLVGAVKGGQAEEDVPAPPPDAVGAANAAETTATAAAAAAAEHDASAAGEQPVEGEEAVKSETAPMVQTTQGKVRGVKRYTIYDFEYYSFENIPYAQPPVGELRFRAPQPPSCWEGIRDGSTFSEKPVQINRKTGGAEGAEDCLYLNVYAKTLVSERPLPVLVWIYGGGFSTGEGSRNHHAPDYFMQGEVPLILVSFNYRLAVLGFLSLCDPMLQVPGNAGLKDQIMALKWVRQHISCFNGDVNNITVFGESAGAAAAHYLTVSDSARGLFHRAILMSGCMLNPWAHVAPVDFPYRLARLHGYAGANEDALVLAYLRQLKPCQLADFNSILTDEDRRKGYLFPFAPCVEPYVGEDCVMPHAPLEMMRNAWSNEIPIIIGGTSFEGLIMYASIKKSASGSLQLLQTDAEGLLPFEISAMHSEDECKQLATQLMSCHFENGNDAPMEQRLLQYMDLFSYKLFWHGLHRTILSRLTHAKAPTYLYRFDFDSPDFNHHRTKFCGQDVKHGAAHADDLSYMFYAKYSWKLETQTAEYKTIRRLVGMWQSFAKNSDPNCAVIEPIVWEPLTHNNPNCALNISHDVEIMQLPETQKLLFWNSLYEPDQLC